MTLRVGYGKMGRSVLLDPKKWGAVGGDNEPPMVLKALAERNPDIEFWVTGRNSGEDPQELGYPSNVINPWHKDQLDWQRQISNMTEDTPEARLEFMSNFDSLTREVYESLDHIIVWTGQHGTSNLPIPKIGDRNETTLPQMSFVNYAGTMIHGINVWRDVHDGEKEETWLCPDPRNYVKARDLKWPVRRSVMSQFVQQRNCKYERYGDPRTPQEMGYTNSKQEPGVWKATLDYTYDRLEIVGIPNDVKPNLEWEGRSNFGIVINEARANVAKDRLTAMLEYVMPLDPAFIYGKWSAKSLEKIGRDIQPKHHSELWDEFRSTRTTLTTPSSGSGWATTKPWESFASGTVCFFHPDYDTQGLVIPTLDHVTEYDEFVSDDLAILTNWLRVTTPESLKRRVEHLNSNAGRSDWEWIVTQQHNLYWRAMQDQQALTEMERRIKL